MNSTNFFSSPDLWLEIFNFLPFDSIKSLGQVNKFFNASYQNVIDPINIGIFPTSIWSNQIFPLLSHHQLRKFQRVNQASRRLTLTKSLSKVMFRSDVSITKLEEIKVGVNLNKTIYERDGNRRCIDILSSAIHPFFSSIFYSLGFELELKDTYINTKTTFKSTAPLKTHATESYKVLLDNATEPPVSSLLVELKDPNQHFVTFDSSRIVKVVGTGRPLFGGRDRAVTIKDVMVPFCKDQAKLDFTLDIGDHTSFGGFRSLVKTSEGFRLGQVAWYS